MTIRSINGVLRAAAFGGAVALLTPVAFADEGGRTGPEGSTQIPDHAEAEARAGAANAVPTVEKVEVAPTHTEAEARGTGAVTVPTAERAPGVPDHATAENRGRVEK